MTHERLAKDILTAVGGPENVERATHCATRLRLVLKDEGKVDKEAVEALDKVAGSVFSGGQYQIIIGLGVPQLHKAFLVAMGTPETDKVTGGEKQETNLFNQFFKVIVSIMTPTFGVMAAAGILKGLLALLLAGGILKEADGAYQIWHAISEAFFYYLPVWVGFNASKVFGGNPFVGAALGAALVYPDILNLQTAGEALTFFGIPIVLVNYTQSLFPAMLSSFVAVAIEKFFAKRLNETISWMFTPFLTFFIAAPLAFLVLGPVMSWLSNTLATIVMTIYGISPILFGIIGGAFWQLVVIFGLHYAFVPILINNTFNLGQDPLNAVFSVTVTALAGAAIGFALKSKNPKNKSLGYSVGLTGLVGITEPIIYSVALPYRRQFIYAMISGGIAGAIQGINQAVAYAFGGGGLMAFPLFIAPDGNMKSFYSFLLASIVAFFGPIVLNVIFGTGEDKQ